MEKMTLKEFNSGNGYASYKLREEINKLKLPQDSILVNFAYTDYGGDFFDRVACEYFKDNECFLVENTSWFGKNGVLYGQDAVEFIEEYEKYPLEFRDIEEFYFMESNDAEYKSFEYFVNDEYRENTKEEKEEIISYLINEKSGYFSIQSSGDLDFCWSDLVEEIKRELNIEVSNDN